MNLMNKLEESPKIMNRAAQMGMVVLKIKRTRMLVDEGTKKKSKPEGMQITARIPNLSNIYYIGVFSILGQSLP